MHQKEKEPPDVTDCDEPFCKICWVDVEEDKDYCKEHDDDWKDQPLTNKSFDDEGILTTPRRQKY